MSLSFPLLSLFLLLVVAILWIRSERYETLWRRRFL
jgi:hypothetical protein